MVTADVLAVVFLFIGLFLAIPAFQLVIRAMWPRVTEQSRRRFDQTPIRTLAVGMFLGLPMLGPALALLSVDIGPVKLAGVWWLGGAMAISLAGLSGLADRVGRTIGGPSDDRRPWWPMVKGAVALELSCLIPIFGWFLLFPVLLAAGAGAALFSVLLPLRDPAVEAQEAATALPAAAHAGS